MLPVLPDGVRGAVLQRTCFVLLFVLYRCI